MCITVASPADTEYVNAKLNPGVNFAHSSPDPRTNRFAAVRHGRLIGFAVLVRHSPEHTPCIGHWIFSLYMLELLYRGPGTEEALTCRVIQVARSEGAPDLLLVVNEINPPAICLYRSPGSNAPLFRDSRREQLEDEVGKTGKRRITMVNPLHA